MIKQRKSLKPRFSRHKTVFVALSGLKTVLTGLKTVLLGLFASAYVFYISTVYAWAGPTEGTAEAKWDEVIGFLVPWLGRLGGVVMLLGGIMFALGFKNDDADGKTRGLSTLVAGAMVIAVGASYRVFVG